MYIHVQQKPCNESDGSMKYAQYVHVLIYSLLFPFHDVSAQMSVHRQDPKPGLITSPFFHISYMHIARAHVVRKVCTFSASSFSMD